MMSEGEKLLTALGDLTNAVEAEIRAYDPALSPLVFARSMAWSTRTYAGSSTLCAQHGAASRRARRRGTRLETILTNDARATSPVDHTRFRDG